jgi:hypothetical protein
MDGEALGEELTKRYLARSGFRLSKSQKFSSVGPLFSLRTFQGFWWNLDMTRSLSRRNAPAIYPFKMFVEAGGLMSYGIDFAPLGHRVADMVDEILKGAKPSDIPVFQPTKFELAINLKTAKALGLTVPPELLATADEVIE